MLRVPCRRINGLLKIVPSMNVAQQELIDPLLLLIAARRPLHQMGFAIAQRQRRVSGVRGRLRGATAAWM